MQMVKNLPAMQETWRHRICGFKSLGQEDLLEKEMATHSSILAWRIQWTEEPEGLWGHKELDMTKQLTHTHTWNIERWCQRSYVQDRKG